jgi:2,4-dienoyl-CoA reductase-like NADH-dependent reductase (Old Yellow Enzyme family)
LVIGFQLTHSGRFLQDERQVSDGSRALRYRHPILDKKFKVTSDEQVFADDEIERLIECYIAAAKIAWDVGADLVDIKHCHGYLLHEFLVRAYAPGQIWRFVENRTRILREFIAGIRASGKQDRDRRCG